jgi:hypothetical protein
MSHALVILETPGDREARGKADGEAAYTAMLAFAERLKADGELLLTTSLSSSQTRVRAGQPVLDGPFAECKELVGGIFLLTEPVTRERALQLAAQCPAAQWATVEVRAMGPCFT